MAKAVRADQVCWINNCATLLHLPDQVGISKSEDGTMRIQSEASGKTLAMGRNNIPVAVAEAARKNKQVASWFNCRVPGSGKPWLEEDTDTSKPEGIAPPDSLTGYGVPAAVSLVESEHELRTLEMWERGEQRPQVAEALRRKILNLGGGRGASIEDEIERRALQIAQAMQDGDVAKQKPAKGAGA